MINELDTVVLSHDIAEHGLKRGDIGPVVHVYKNEQAFEVEFITGEDETVAMLTLTSDVIRVMRGKEILHIREI